ncbi:MAG: carboxypeptidase-like regulatory domain-containing protein, partial [Bacteroidales bacterium]
MKNKILIKKARSFILLCLFLVVVAGNAYAQERTITGVVVDDSGVPLPGVTIMIQGTSTGTQTGYDGDYSLPNVSPDDVLVFSFVGMATQEIPVEDQAVINVTMQTEAIGLEEVVTIGYGTQIRANLTGSVGRA